MDRFLAIVDRWLETVAMIAVRVSGVFLVLMFIFINIEVLGRYVFGFSTLIADEYVGYFFVWMTFLGFAATLRGGHFLRVRIVLNRVPPGVSDVLQGSAALLSAGLCGVLVYSSAHTVRMSFLFKSVSLAYSETPLMIPQFIIPIAMALLAVVFLNEGVRRLRSAMGAADPGKGAGP